MGYCRLWASASSGKLFLNPEYDREEISNWWKMNDIHPDVFELKRDRIYLKFTQLPDNRYTLEIIFVSIADRLSEDDSVIRFEYRNEDLTDISAFFIGRKIYLRVPYILDRSEIPKILWENKNFCKVFWKI